MNISPEELRELMMAAYYEGCPYGSKDQVFWRALNLGFNADMEIDKRIGDDDSLIDMVSKLRNIMARK